MKRKVLIVDDSMFMNRLVSDFINSSEDLEVIGVARNGREAVALNKRLKPDVILLDIEMPIMDGIEALKIIMIERPCPVVMFSSLTKEGAEITLKALDEGAYDFVSKPRSRGYDLPQEVVDEIIIKLRHAKYVPKKTIYSQTQKKQSFAVNEQIKSFKHIVAIGTSTGGPRALQDVLSEFPANFEAPIVVVQHMPKLFTKPFADRLNSTSNLNIKEAENGDELMAGCVYIAPGDSHMRVIKSGTSYKIETDSSPKVSGHRPSVDVLYDSLVPLAEKIKITAVQMTGMGRDGADAMKRLHDKGAKCIVQDKETSVVFGMPGSAIELGAADVVVSLNKIASEIFRSTEV